MPLLSHSQELATFVAKEGHKEVRPKRPKLAWRNPSAPMPGPLTWVLSPLQGQQLQLLGRDVISFLLRHEGREVWRQLHSGEVVCHGEEEPGVHTVKHPLGLHVVPGGRRVTEAA